MAQHNLSKKWQATLVVIYFLLIICQMCTLAQAETTESTTRYSSDELHTSVAPKIVAAIAKAKTGQGTNAAVANPSPQTLKKIPVKVEIASILPLLKDIPKPKPIIAKVKHYQVFANDMSTSKWEVGGDQEHCYMTQTINSYGEAGFHRFAGSEDEFWLHSWSGISHEQPGQMTLASATWQATHSPHPLADLTFQPQDPLVKVEPSLTKKLLQGLRSGQQLLIEYPLLESKDPDWIMVKVSGVRFQKSFSDYMQCQSKLLPFAFKDVQKTIIYFDARSIKVGPSLPELDRLVRYVKAGAKIEKVVITGYTDNAGWYELNRRVSYYRAESIKNYLLQAGVPVQLLEVNAAGDSNPIGNNSTKEGRAKNRRVELLLINKKSDL